MDYDETFIKIHFFFPKYIYKKFLAREFSGYTILDEKELNIYFIY